MDHQTQTTPVSLRFWPHLLRPVTERKDKFKRSLPIGNRVLVFDCETTEDAFQRLRFGCYAIWKREGQKHVLEGEGVFVGERLSPAEVAEIEAFAHTQGLAFITRKEFVKLLKEEGYDAGTLVVGYNLPFDISRIAVCATSSRGRNRNAFSFVLDKRCHIPNIRIKQIEERAAFIEWLKPHSKYKPQESRIRFEGRFLDASSLVTILVGHPLSLKDACEWFHARVRKSEYKGEDAPIAEQLSYCRNDVQATFSLYEELRRWYDKQYFADWMQGTSRGDPHAVPITQVYTKASMAKALFRRMGFLGTHDALQTVPPQHLGYAATACYAGRNEVHVRAVPCNAVDLDFTSCYPAVFTLQNLWGIYTAKALGIEEVQTREVEEILQEVSHNPKILFNQNYWKKLPVFVQVTPKGAILPIRTVQGDDYRLTTAPVTSDTPLWYTLPDLIASVLLGHTHEMRGKSGEGFRGDIHQAFRVVPRASRRLNQVKVEGFSVIPDDRFFARLVQIRKKLRKDCPTAGWIKEAANSACFGLAFELDEEQLAGKDRKDIHCYHLGHQEWSARRRYEKPGKYAHPFVASLVTAGARLLLAMLQREVQTRNACLLWCNTDGMAIALEPVGSEASEYGVRGIREEDLQAIIAEFNRLNPYDEPVQHFLREETRGTAFAIAPNLYCIRKEDGSFGSIPRSGLGEIVWPNGISAAEGIRTFWNAILTEEVPEGWKTLPLLRKYPIKRPQAWKLAKRIGDVLPFGFLTVAVTAGFGEKREYLFGAHCKDAKEALHQRFYDKDGQWCKIEPLPDEELEVPPKRTRYVETFEWYLDQYRRHHDQKMQTLNGEEVGPTTKGKLVPRPVSVGRISYSGKAINALTLPDGVQIPGLENDETLALPGGRITRRRLPAEHPQMEKVYRACPALKLLEGVPATQIERVGGPPRKKIGEYRRGALPSSTDIMKLGHAVNELGCRTKGEELKRSLMVLKQHPPKQVAHDLGISAQQWRKIRAGKHRPSQRTQEAILNYAKNLGGVRQ